MELFAAVGFGSFVTASLVVGLRLLALARRTRELPELAIGTALFVGGGLGYALVVAAFALRAFPAPLVPVALVAGSFGTALGAGALALGVQRIFRPGAVWARVLWRGIAAVLALGFAGRMLDPTAVPAADWIFWSSTLASTAAYTWSALESLRWRRLVLRRARLELADPALARRFALWGLAAAAAVGIHLCGMANRLAGHTGIHPALLAVQSLLGLVAAVGLWLAFFPGAARRASPSEAV
jgi:hypothetical protein